MENIKCDKICTKCLELKTIDCFVKQTKAPDGLSYWCKTCLRNYQQNKYYSDLSKSRELNNAWKAKKVKWIQDIKRNTPCKDCGKIYEPYCMDYDHIPEKGKKIKCISRMVLESCPQQDILNEIAKCDLICLLCHNKRTFERFNQKLGPKRKYRPSAQKNIQIINDFKNKPCSICNQQYDSYNMQIDHIDPMTKLYDVCQLKHSKSIILIAELKKCQVVCALCHRKKSILEQKDHKYSIKISKKKLFCNINKRIKECSFCHKIKSFDQFIKISKRKNKSGIGASCKECRNQSERDRRKTHKI